MRLLRIIGFVVGAALGFWLFSFEYGGGSDAVWYAVTVGGVEVFHVGGYYADICLRAGGFLVAGLVGIIGAMIAGRLARRFRT
jgi:hypothetical protein